MLIDFIEGFNSLKVTKGYELSEIEITFDSAYCVQKVMRAVCHAKFRGKTKPNNNHKFEFEDQELTPAQLIEKVKNGHWKYLGPDRFYQRLSVYHPNYGDVVLIIRAKPLKNGKIIYDVLLCNSRFYTANRIDKCYLRRWKIELQFKYYKQHLSLGSTSFIKLGAIQSSWYCVAIAGLLVALYCRKLARIISFRKAVKPVSSFFSPINYYIIQ